MNRHDFRSDDSKRIGQTEDPIHDMQLLRDLQLINQRTQCVPGPLPPSGLPVEPKRKPDIQRTRPARGPADKEDDAMRASHVATAAMIGLVGTLVACAQGDNSQSITHGTPNAQQKRATPDNETASLQDEDESGASDQRNSFINVEDIERVSSHHELSDRMRYSYFACLNASDGSTWAIQACISEEWEFQDSRMNTAYQGLREQLSEKKWLEVRNEQRKWLSDFESKGDCAWNPETDGQDKRLSSNECSLRKLATRATILERLLTTEELKS